MFSWGSVTLAFLIVLVSGLGHGIWSGRWVDSHDLELAKAHLASVPTQVGDWVLTDEKQISQKEQQIAGIVGFLSRVYLNQRTQQSVSVLLVCGRPGAIAVHTPDVCFEGAGYRGEGRKYRDLLVVSPRKQKAEFWREKFVRVESGIPIPLRVYWGWNAEGNWVAPENPRLEFWADTVLYKLYVSRLVTEEDADPEPCFEFFREFLPALQPILFPEPAPAEPRRK